MKHLSGWRHSGILKMHALTLLLDHGFDLLIVDVDWRFVANPLAALRAQPMSIVAARDQTRHMLNVGAMYIRATSATRRLALRTFNRTFAAWDQAVFTEEAGAAGVGCCWANNLGGTFLVHPRVSRGVKLKLRGNDQQCRDVARRQTTLSPPPASADTAAHSMWQPRWRSGSGAYNGLDKAYYRFRCSDCDNVCTRRRCDLANAG